MANTAHSNALPTITGEYKGVRFTTSPQAFKPTGNPLALISDCIWLKPQPSGYNLKA